MKHLLKYISLSIVLLLVIDVVFGFISKAIVANGRLKGDFATIDYVVKECDDDIVIIGSSVALYSTKPSAINDSLGLSVWNCASNGQMLPYFESILECLFTHHKPKIVLWGVRASEISAEYTGDRFKMLSLYYNMGYPTLDKYLEGESTKEKLLMKSNLYRFNTTWIRAVLYYFFNSGEQSDNGFIAKPHPPFPPNMQYLNDEKEIPSPKGEKMFRHIIKMCKENDVKLILYITPVYQEYRDHKSAQAAYLKKVCRENGVVALDYLQDSLFLTRPDLFYDNIHLNADGAEIFTKKLVRDLILIK